MAIGTSERLAGYAHHRTVGYSDGERALCAELLTELSGIV